MKLRKLPDWLEDSNRKTYGEKMVEHQQKTPIYPKEDMLGVAEAVSKKMMSEVWLTIEEALKHSDYRTKDFYVVLCVNIEHYFNNLRGIPIARQSCPTPVYEQVVWKYHHAGGLEYLWTIPGAFRYHHILQNKNMYMDTKRYGNMAKFVHLMESGELLNWVKKENGDKKDMALKIIYND